MASGFHVNVGGAQAASRLAPVVTAGPVFADFDVANDHPLVKPLLRKLLRAQRHPDIAAMPVAVHDAVGDRRSDRRVLTERAWAQQNVGVIGRRWGRQVDLERQLTRQLVYLDASRWLELDRPRGRLIVCNGFGNGDPGSDRGIELHTAGAADPGVLVPDGRRHLRLSAPPGINVTEDIVLELLIVGLNVNANDPHARSVSAGLGDHDLDDYRKIPRYSGVEGSVMTTVAAEEQQVRELLDRVEELEDIAASLPEQDDRRARLICVARETLRDVGPVRPVIVARLLQLNEKTIRAWSEEGVLAKASDSPRLLLDPEQVHRVWHLVRELRAAGKTRGLLDEVYRRLSDAALLQRADLQESLGQMRRGEGSVLVPRRTPAA